MKLHLGTYIKRKHKARRFIKIAGFRVILLAEWAAVFATN